MFEDEFRDIRAKQIQATIELAKKQAAWTGPRTIALIVLAVAGLSIAVLLALDTYAPQQPPQIVLQPGSIQIMPAPEVK